MGLFSRNKEGGIMDAIRCDEKDFLIWKWRPDRNSPVGSSRKENAIRYGSGLSVRPGQAAIFLYPSKEQEYDVIKGPYNDVIKTDNMPVLSSIVGLAYAGGTPFQAEVYYVNLAKGMEIPFFIPSFRVIPAEPEYKAYDIQVSIKGSLVFEVSTQNEYIKYLMEAWGGNDTSLDEFEDKLKTMLTQEVKQIVANAPKDTGVFIMHFNGLIGEMGQYICNRLQNAIAHRFGVLATGVYISDIRYNEDSESYQRLKRITEDQAHLFNMENEKTALLSFEIQRQTMETDAFVRNQTTLRMADIQMGHTEDMLARMREEGQFAQHLQSEEAARQMKLGSESAFINAHALNQQTEVLKTGMQNMGSMGAMNLGGGGDGHMNPAGMMTSMMMGASVAGQVGNMMNQMGGQMAQNMASAGQTQQAPPPLPNQMAAVPYYLYVNNAQVGPCDVNTVAQMVGSGQANGDTLGWCEGMASWTPLRQIPALSSLFQRPAGGPPPIPGMPPVPPVPPVNM